MQNKPLKVVPRLNGKQIDIFTMYRRVAKLGGSAKVSAEKRWGDIADGEPLHPPRYTRYTRYTHPVTPAPLHPLHPPRCLYLARV